MFHASRRVRLEKLGFGDQGEVKRRGVRGRGSHNFPIFVGYLLENYGPQWELEFLPPAAWPIFERLIAYVVGYAKLTSYNKQLLRGLYDTWSVEERVERLRSLAASGGFLEIE